ncbi:GntR family transcriptional regulator [Clostridium akagii]|uniref:GntR family transcriptional regulator n=1 Tax=Clostridium akagii TaxID=91623 RepID=UPI00047EAA29|nr:GntR family transcriptional regulator [Clostridium akagii]
MFVKIDFSSEIPIYTQLKQQIIEGIADGSLNEGESLPSVRQMAEDIGINLHTVNKAYALLRDDNFIIMDRRVGAVINSKHNMKLEDYDDKFVEDIKPIIAEAFCRGMKEEEITRKIQEIYLKFLEA